ncbi:MAG TPA: MBOAT family O-acyltransferase [Leptospiraceae bacterium]|nr:MBOAT family O-acyltransferase [Leptospiraceae bacterium]
MLFNSINFLVFFSVFYLIYTKVNLKIQNWLLLFGGIVFYSFWNYKMTFLLLFCIYFNFIAGIQLVKNQDLIKRKRILLFTIALNLGILFIFKYTVFVIQSFNDISRLANGSLKLSVIDIILPIGISFYTFHNISYIYDVYKEKIKPTHNLLTYAVYDLFFPLLLSGPIERAERLIPQIEKEREITKEKFQSGLILVIWGIFKKVFVSDNLAPFVNMALYPYESIPKGLVYFVAAAFAFQVYADFSGYTDAARGMARMIGFELSLNFNLPLFKATNPSEFWKRWHISLSTWLRDYVYIPLGGNRNGIFYQNMNLMIVWILGGLWHGATYGYLIWGIYCGLQVVIYNVYAEMKNKHFANGNPDSNNKIASAEKIRIISASLWLRGNIFNLISIFITFMLFGLGLLLFRVENPTHLMRLMDNMGGIYLNWVLICKFLFYISPIIILDSLQVWHKDLEYFSSSKIHPALAYGIMTVFAIQFCLFSVFESKEFFYFQF